MKKIINFLILFFVSFSAIAASNSNPGLYYGQVPTAAQWNSYFSAKLDYSAGAVNTIPYWDASGNLLSAPISGNCTSIANVFTCPSYALLAGSASQVFNAAPAITATQVISQIQLTTGWIFDPNTWTATVAGVAGSLNANGSINITPVAAQFTVPGDQTATFVRGVKLKFTQTTVKYGYVQSSSFGAGVTTVILVANADYQMTIAAITSASFSFGEPSGFPSYLNINRSIISGGGALTSITPSIRMKMNGSKITIYASIIIVTVGTATGDIFVSLPISASSDKFAGGGAEIVVAGYSLLCYAFSSTQMRISKYDATTPIIVNNSLVAELVYE